MNSGVNAIRAFLSTAGLDAFLVPRSDEHLGEYVPPCGERLAWLTGFTGSAGLAVVCTQEAAVFSDGRYTLQLAHEIDPSIFQAKHIVNDPVPAWIAARAKRVGYDPWLISEEGLARFAEAGLDMVAVSPNPIDGAWLDRPAPPAAAAVPHPLVYAGHPAADKIAAIAATLQAQGNHACVITDPASLAWLLNIRGGDLAFTPVALGFAIVRADATVTLFMAASKLSPETRSWLGNQVAVEPPEAFAACLGGMAGLRVAVDKAGAPMAVAQALRNGGSVVVALPDLCLLPKACKNPVEQEGARRAHVRDSAAVVQLLRGVAAGQTETQVADNLLRLRRGIDGFRGESFPTIAGSGPNGAIIHYRPMPGADRTIQPNELLLVDSGGQFVDGTTDVTRTVWTGPSTPPSTTREHYTRVLKGHVALASTVFPPGVAGPHLDAFARRALWDAGLDYDHGTGHGVGSYLSVHEGPVSLSRAGRMTPLAEGMILSDEPGLYLPGEYGIRIENLLLVQKADKGFLRFETLTLAPYDRSLIDTALLSGDERAWIDAYHARVAAAVGPSLGQMEAGWLFTACAKLA
jgi:Xaa-Pro aminopeptidase